MYLGIGRRGVVTDFSNVHGIEQIMITTVITMHVDFALFGNNAVNFFIWQGF